MRYLKFKDEEQFQVRFALIQLVFQQSRYAPRSSGDSATISDVVKAVNEIGVEYGDREATGEDPEEKAMALQIAEPALRLKDGGGRVALETAEHKMLLQLIDATPFRPNFMPKVQDMRRWVKAAQDKGKDAGHEDGDDVVDAPSDE